ncbi:MAG: sodium:solute symporter family protein [Deltaproteobacteria bacterium]|nr:sodium:solute symporter family protein [Deltaproteobacteria bacterium]
MIEKTAAITSYFVIILLIGLYSRKYSKNTPEDFFLGGRNLGPILLFFTMAATNFSAFTVFGFSGAGYRSGYAFYPIMAFGTGFMAITFSFIGKRVYELGKEKGYITPSELIGKHYQSRVLQLLVFAVMVIFTLPYIAIQPISAGYTLESLLGIPYFLGGALVMAVIVFYVFLGGFRGVVWTDAVQGGMMIILMSVALFLLAAPHGGVAQANLAVFEKYPELYSRPGMGNAFPVSIWFSYMLLWLLCDPVFPQLFQRFFSAKNHRSLDLTMLAYPAICGFLFLLPITIGVIGRLSFPGLSGKEADKILPLLLSQQADNWLGALILTAGLAALMSTLDSQLLTLSSMFTRDAIANPKNGKKQEWLGKLFILVLAGAGLVIAYRPPSTILIIATEAFTGLAVLFPTVLGGLYWRKASSLGAILSILVGEALVVGYMLKLLPTFGFLPVVPVLFVTGLVFFVVSFSQSSRPFKEQISSWKISKDEKTRKNTLISSIVFSALFFLGIDFWAWGSASPLIGGFPWWVWYFVGLNLLVMVAMACFLTEKK